MNKTSNTLESITFVPAFLRMRKNQFYVSFMLIILGAIIGLVFSLLVPPVYEAESRLITNMELVQEANISEIMVDSQIEIVRELLFHEAIINELLTSEAAQGNQIDLQYLRDHSLLERRLMTTLIQVRSTDPIEAARIANSWAKIGFEKLTEAYAHALLVSEAKWTLTSIEDCQTDTKVFETAYCQSLDPEEAAELADGAHAIILAESPYALGLTKDIQISQYQEAGIPKRPVQFSRSNLVLAGAMIGLFLSFIIYELPKKSEKTEA